MTKNELKELIKECINEETSMNEAWFDTIKHLGKQAGTAVQQKAQQVATAAKQQYQQAQKAGASDEFRRIQINTINDLKTSYKKAKEIGAKAGMNSKAVGNVYITILTSIIGKIKNRKI
jgi:hypothetical protein